MKTTTDYVNQICIDFKTSSNPEVAKGQKAYMKHNFEFLGLKTPSRRALQRPYLHTKSLPEKTYLTEIVDALWAKPQREFQYFGQELAVKYIKNHDKKDIDLYSYMISHKSWWDTVDFIASNLVGSYFKSYPEQRWLVCKVWLESKNIWLQRSALLFQLKYKKNLDVELLEYNINQLLGSKEFFINKAIGWILREYSKTNPQWVLDFVNSTEVSTLSYREATKYLNIK